MANIGETMAGAVDAEVAKFRGIQEEIQKLRGDQQLLMQQQSENEMVKQELALLDDDNSQVYKMVGPVLMKNDTEDAKQTIEQRLELITGELKKVEKNIKAKDELASKTAKKVQEMQSTLQTATAEAAKAAAQHAAQG